MKLEAVNVVFDICQSEDRDFTIDQLDARELLISQTADIYQPIRSWDCGLLTNQSRGLPDRDNVDRGASIL